MRSSDEPGTTYTLIYDGECRICRRSVAWVRGIDRFGAVETIPYQDPEVPERFPEIPAERYPEAMQLVAPDGRRWEGGWAVEELLGLFPQWRWTGVIFRIPGMRRLVRWGYGIVARNRRAFGCGNHCGIRP